MESGQEWVLAKVGESAGCTSDEIRNAARLGLVSVRRMPGCDPRYLLSDIERLVKASTKLASHHHEAVGAA